MNHCQHCNDVQELYEIRGPEELKNAIRVVRDNLLDGTIVESAHRPAGILKVKNIPFGEIKESGPYEDELTYYFECPRCKQIYSLSCETYHGGGGQWGPCDG